MKSFGRIRASTKEDALYASALPPLTLTTCKWEGHTSTVSPLPCDPCKLQSKEVASLQVGVEPHSA